MFPPSFLPSFPHRLLHSHIAQGDSLPLSSCGVVTRYFCLRRLSRLSPSCPIVLRVSLSFPAARYVGIVIILPPIFPSLSSFLRCSLGGRMWSGGGRKLCQNERPRDDRRHGGGCDVSQTFCKKREGEGEERTRYSFFPPSPRLGCFRTMQRMMQRIYLSCIQVPLRARGRLKQSNNCGADDEQLASF